MKQQTGTIFEICNAITFNKQIQIQNKTRNNKAINILASSGLLPLNSVRNRKQNQMNLLIVHLKKKNVDKIEK